MVSKVFRIFDSLIICNIKFLFIKLLHIKHFKYSIKNIISPINVIDIQNNGNIIFGKWLNIPSKSYFGVRERAILEIKEGTFVNSNCQIIAHKKIIIGRNVCIGPNTVIMDHDHVFDKNGVKKKKFDSKSIVIGDRVWIGANCVILKGVTIGENSVIAAGSVITKDVPPNSILIQKKENMFIKMR